MVMLQNYHLHGLNRLKDYSWFIYDNHHIYGHHEIILHIDCFIKIPIKNFNFFIFLFYANSTNFNHLKKKVFKIITRDIINTIKMNI